MRHSTSLIIAFTLLFVGCNEKNKKLKAGSLSSAKDNTVVFNIPVDVVSSTRAATRRFVYHKKIQAQQDKKKPFVCKRINNVTICDAENRASIIKTDDILKKTRNERKPGVFNLR